MGPEGWVRGGKGGCADGWIEDGECRVRGSVTLGMVVIERIRVWCSWNWTWEGGIYLMSENILGRLVGRVNGCSCYFVLVYYV